MQEKSDRYAITSRLPRQMLNRQAKGRQISKSSSNNPDSHTIPNEEFFKSNVACTSELSDNYWQSLIGQPVCISGVKEGLLRYYGRTRFADGLWCGVELNEPVGKHNGTVNGINYFICKPDHGIFAPVSKVTLLLPQKSDTNLTKDFNLSQKRPRPASFHEEYQNAGFLKQSSSDPNFQRRHSLKSSCVNYHSHNSTWFGDKRYLTEQRELNLSQHIPEGCKRTQLYLPFPLKSASNLLENVSLIPRQGIQYSFEKKDASNYVHQNMHNNADYLRQNKSPSKIYSISGNVTSESFSGFDGISKHEKQTLKGEQNLKHYVDSCQGEKYLIEDKDDEDEPLSVECDESLGILSPSQMKDFTLCGDLSTSCSEIARAIDFPSSESFDDVNELPEDEIAHDVSIQYMSTCSSSVVSSYTVIQSNIVDSVKTQHMLQELKHNVNKPSLSCTEQFLLNVSSTSATDVHFDIQQTDSGSPKDNVSSMLECDEMPNTEQNLSEDTKDNLSSENNISENLSCLNEVTLIESEVEVDLNDQTNKEENGQENKSDELSEKIENSTLEITLTNDQNELILKEKSSVSWEECVVQSPDKICIKDERPESIYTVSSCDTGYQDDGDEDLDGPMTTSVESTKENKKLSVLSRDSGVIMEDLDPLKAVESASTSGYSTGLSDSYYNDRQEEECSRPFMEDSYRDVQDSYHSDDGLLDAPISSSIDENIGTLPEKSGFFDMDSYKETETHTEFQITESNTILGLDSTCKSFTEDESVFNESGKITAINSEIDTKEPLSIDKKEQSLSNESGQISSQSSPEKKSEKICVPKKTEIPQDSVEKSDVDTKKQILKSPKRKVMGRIKSVLENSTNKTKTEITVSDKKYSPVKKQSRWGSVTSKIAASLADEKTKAKIKREIKSKVDTNLAAARQACKSPKSEHSSISERVTNVSVSSPTFSRTRKTYHENHYNTSWCNSTSHVTQIERSPKSPRPSKTCCSPRSASPVAVSECSTTSHTTSSHHSKSKIAVWKGSNNAVGVAPPPVAPPSPIPPVKKPFMSGAFRLISRVNRIQNNAKDKQTTNKTVESPVSVKGAPSRTAVITKQDSTPKVYCAKFRSPKEQHGHEGRPIVPPKPVRPPMWLSKAELTQEIQHLSSLCETRTKELNRLKMQTKHVTSGFDALAIAIQYMTEDLKAFENPDLLTNLKQTQEKVDKEKKDLECYEKKIAALNNLHAKDMNDMLEAFTSRHESTIQELILKHTTEMNFLQEQHKKEIASFAEALSASCQEEKLQQEKLVEDLKKELKQQREEVEIFHKQELDDLEERYHEEQNALRDEIKKLQKQLSEAKQTSCSIEETLQKDTDAKLHWLSEKRNDLQKEVDSLKAVLEIKNNELHALRKENLEMQKELEDLPLAKEKIKMLQARAEDLQALMSEKVLLERSLSSECKVMRESFEKSEKMVKRLSMENEELQWRLKEVSDSSILAPASEDAAEINSSEDFNISDDLCVFEEELTPNEKTPSPVTISKPLFFTYMNEEELALSSMSPRSHYKPIKPCPPSSHKSSPARAIKSSTSSPRKSKGSADSSPHCGGGTPRKIAKHLSRSTPHLKKHKRKSSNEEKVQEENIPESLEIQVSGIAESLVSSASSDNSVFEPCFLEEHSEEICKTLKQLQEENNLEFVCDVPSPSYDSNGKWQLTNEMKEAAVDQTSSIESIDPKTFYHVAFPVLRESESTPEVEPDKIAKELSENKNK